MSHGSGSETRLRTSYVTVRLTPDERTIIAAAADRAGLTVASYARQTLLGAPTPRQVRRPPVERRELARFLGELGSIGNNLNQIARAANSNGGVDRVAFAEATDGLRRMRDAVLTALGREP